MPSTIHKELDPFFETIGLLMVGCRFDKSRRETLDSLAELGFDGEKFYAEHLAVFERYAQTFRKYMAIDPEVLPFLEEDDLNFSLILLSLLLESRPLLASIDDLEDREINGKVVKACREQFNMGGASEGMEQLDDIVRFLDGIPLVENAKWKVMRIMQDPKRQLKRLAHAVNHNLAAFKKAENSVKKPLSKLLDDYLSSVRGEDSRLVFKFKNSLSETTDVYPTLASPLSQIMFDEASCYYGLLSGKLLKIGESLPQSRETLLLGLKSLSDRSKFEILCSLKASPKYNLEIAEQLRLTAATTSHHMGVLLASGFVGVEKRNGKVYYHLEQAVIRQFIDTLEQTLL